MSAADIGDDARMAARRSQALKLADGTDWSRCSDHEVVAQLAAAVAARHLAAAIAPTKLMRMASPRVAAPGSSPPAAPASSPRAAPAAAPAADDSTFLSLDVAAMVATLRQAAETGAPFCEECARAAREAAAA